MRRNIIIFSAIAVMAMSGGFFLAMVLSPPSKAVLPVQPLSDVSTRTRAEDLVGQRRPDFTHSDIAGNQVSVSDFKGQVLLINFWATWCTPCVEEMPMLSEIQRNYSSRNLKIIGIALDDADRAREFAAELDIAYPILTGGADVVITGRKYGNSSGMLPFTVLIDREGIIRWALLGALNRVELEQQLALLE